MQRNGQIHLQRLLAKFANSWNQPHRRNSHVSCAQVKTIRTVQNTQRLHDIIIIMQRFAHAHQDNIGNVVNGSTPIRVTAKVALCRPWCISQFSSKEEYLCHNLSCSEMTIKTHLTCCAECTPESTTSLCRNTYCSPGTRKGYHYISR